MSFPRVLAGLRPIIRNSVRVPGSAPSVPTSSASFAEQLGHTPYHGGQPGVLLCSHRR